MSAQRSDRVQTRRRFNALLGLSTLTLFAGRGGAARAQATSVGPARYLGGGVAANPWDRHVLGFEYDGRRHLLVITQAGEVWAHEVKFDAVLPARRLYGGIGPLDGVRWVLMDLLRHAFIVIGHDGAVAWHSFAALLNVVPLFGPQRTHLVGLDPQDRRAVFLHDRLFVFRADGRVGLHSIDYTRPDFIAVGPPTATAAGSYGPIASQPQDRWLIPLCGDRFGVITSDGSAFAHSVDVGRNFVHAPVRLNTAQPIARNAVDRFVVPIADSIYVVTASGEVYVHGAPCP